ncbi:hypothetical protein VHEMI01185 [[Torrubiella] hemipterigena]|uniref:Uncharacterized protein n=1 Tax=[Torrubiella] hemipterigena TaxID=1531966 RepID=A0A0A1SL70_9HYPO|nr:hypothetical protein VHEMI01185 [[Torrubiella] hemipterigena]
MMLKPTLLVLFGFLLSLISANDGLTPLPGTVVPPILFRGDSRGPDIIDKAGGLKGFGFSRTTEKGASTITVFDHVNKKYTPPARLALDPFVSTTPDAVKAREFGKFIYTINRAAVSSPIFDAKAEFETAKKIYPHPTELEYSVKGEIPLKAITKVHMIVNGVPREMVKGTDGKWRIAGSKLAQPAQPAQPGKPTTGGGSTSSVPSTGKPAGGSKIPVKTPGHTFAPPNESAPTKQTSPSKDNGNSKIPVKTPKTSSPGKTKKKGGKGKRWRIQQTEEVYQTE